MRRRRFSLIILVLAILVGVFVWHEDRSDDPAPNASGDKTEQAKNNFDKHQYSISNPASLWVVVNKQRPLNPKTYAPSDLTPVGNGQYMRAAAAAALTKIIAAARTAGYTLTPASGYRSYATQVAVYNNEVSAFGQAKADSESARPGYSEHQTGWAMDLGSGACSIQDCFGDTPGGKWAIANAYKYGFLLRYPANKVNVTGYRNESWHFRYVGAKLSNELYKDHIETLEEFFGLPAAPDYK